MWWEAWDLASDGATHFIFVCHCFVFVQTTRSRPQLAYRIYISKEPDWHWHFLQRRVSVVSQLCVSAPQAFINVQCEGITFIYVTGGCYSIWLWLCEDKPLPENLTTVHNFTLNFYKSDYCDNMSHSSTEEISTLTLKSCNNGILR